ncbi:MAG: hypothetical protein HRU20_27020 [Pseudomonadales bacterium]|nr:hypothetical protein [Pseudomonadales bacterium]
MVKLHEVFSEFSIVQTLSAQLSWSHFVQFISFEQSIKRDFICKCPSLISGQRVH